MIEDHSNEDILEIGKKAKEAAYLLSSASSEAKNKALTYAANHLRASKDEIIKANKIDVDDAVSRNIDKAMIDRLKLDDKRIESIAKGLEDIAKLDDPVGKTTSKWDRPSGLAISRFTVPLGVIGIIYESRPNVTADAGALCLKSGNAAILRGGSESFFSSKEIVKCLHSGLIEAGLPIEAIQLIPTKDRAAVGQMLKMSEYIDVIVPRGGKGLCQRVQDESKVPTLLHLDGNCHTYIHKDADLKMAIDVVYNAKLRRTGICGATESIVVDKEIASKAIPLLVESLSKGGCIIKGDEIARSIDNKIETANNSDWDTEYLDSIVSLKVVENINDAIIFVNKHSSHHTDAIITANDIAAQQYLRQVDSAIVMHNTSTQFADGGEFGMGAEIGISTGRLHARGPVGVEQLTTYKYLVESEGKTRPA